jgi:hypothetical protein
MSSKEEQNDGGIGHNPFARSKVGLERLKRVYRYMVTPIYKWR